MIGRTAAAAAHPLRFSPQYHSTPDRMQTDRGFRPIFLDESQLSLVVSQQASEPSAADGPRENIAQSQQAASVNTPNEIDVLEPLQLSHANAGEPNASDNRTPLIQPILMLSEEIAAGSNVGHHTPLDDRLLQEGGAYDHLEDDPVQLPEEREPVREPVREPERRSRSRSRSRSLTPAELRRRLSDHRQDEMINFTMEMVDQHRRQFENMRDMVMSYLYNNKISFDTIGGFLFIFSKY